jgi:hypothetical protein
MQDDVNDALAATESAVADIWENMLGQRPARSAKFFEVGGNSLLAAELASRVRRQLNKKTRLMLIFEKDVFADYARAVHEAPNATTPIRR